MASGVVGSGTGHRRWSVGTGRLATVTRPVAASDLADDDLGAGRADRVVAGVEGAVVGVVGVGEVAQRGRRDVEHLGQRLRAAAPARA